MFYRGRLPIRETFGQSGSGLTLDVLTQDDMATSTHKTNLGKYFLGIISKSFPPSLHTIPKCSATVTHLSLSSKKKKEMRRKKI